MSRAGARGPSRGFTLLEVMIALAILAVALVWLVEATARAVAAENHARQITRATFKARRLLIEYEDQVQREMMQDDAFATAKEFVDEEEVDTHMKCVYTPVKPKLPSANVLQEMMTKGQGGSGGTPDPSNPLGALSSSGGINPATGGTSSSNNNQSTQMISQQFELVKTILEKGIRQVPVECTWSEGGATKSVTVLTYITDPRRVDTL